MASVSQPSASHSWQNLSWLHSLKITFKYRTPLVSVVSFVLEYSHKLVHHYHHHESLLSSVQDLYKAFVLFYWWIVGPEVIMIKKNNNLLLTIHFSSFSFDDSAFLDSVIRLKIRKILLDECGWVKKFCCYLLFSIFAKTFSLYQHFYATFAVYSRNIVCRYKNKVEECTELITYRKSRIIRGKMEKMEKMDQHNKFVHYEGPLIFHHTRE